MTPVFSGKTDINKYTQQLFLIEGKHKSVPFSTGKGYLDYPES